MGNDHEDILWADEVLNGQMARYALLVDKYKDTVFSLTMGMLKNREDAEEVAQDVFLKIFKALPRFKRKAKFSTWMYRIAYNECISHLRKQKIRSLSTDQVSPAYFAEAGDSTAEQEATERKHKALQQALEQLQETDRALIHFFYFDKLPVDEIAKITGLSVSNVKTKLFRIRKKLYNEMTRILEKEQVENAWRDK
jgi:RNA polymerase sigma factor (sigma-70 family)